MTTENMTTMTVKELREIAKDAGISGIYKMKKDKLISAIESATHDDAEESTTTTESSDVITINDPSADSEFQVIGSKKHNVLWNVATDQPIQLIKLHEDDVFSLLDDHDKNLHNSVVVKSFSDFKSAVKYLRENDLGDRWWAARSLNDQVPMTNGVKLDEDVTTEAINRLSNRMHFEDNGSYMLNYVK